MSFAVQPPAWYDDAACVGTAYPDVFFPEQGGHNTGPIAKKEYCAGCPVQTLCLQYALDHDLEGVWGNTTDQERREMKKQASTITCPHCDKRYASQGGLNVHQSRHCKENAA